MTITNIKGIAIPDSKLAREVTELVQDTESPLLFHHSSRVYYFGALAGKRRGLKFDPELLYVGAMFHDMGLTHQHASTDERFEVDGANAARDFLRRHGITPADIDLVWTAIDRHRSAYDTWRSSTYASRDRLGHRRRGNGCTRSHLSRIQRVRTRSDCSGAPAYRPF